MGYLAGFAAAGGFVDAFEEEVVVAPALGGLRSLGSVDDGATC